MADRPKRTHEEMGFWDHIEELRMRLVRSAIYVAIGGVAAWFFRSPLLAALEYPAIQGAHRAGIPSFNFRIFEAAGGLVLMMTVSAVAGVVLTSPLLTMELWGFLSPALQLRERRWALWAIPAATALFLAGVATWYWISPSALGFFFAFNLSLGVHPELTLAPYLTFFLQLALIFGVLFELPLFLMVLGWAGVVTSAGLVRQWRVAIVAIFLAAGLVTPTGDALTMTVLAAPMLLMYGLSIFLVRSVERKRAAPSPEEAAEAEAAPEAAAGAEEVDIDELYRQINEQNQGLDR
jgi:sec-independent protein translocase protein TatC